MRFLNIWTHGTKIAHSNCSNCALFTNSLPPLTSICCAIKLSETRFQQPGAQFPSPWHMVLCPIAHLPSAHGSSGYAVFFLCTTQTCTDRVLYYCISRCLLTGGSKEIWAWRGYWKRKWKLCRRWGRLRHKILDHSKHLPLRRKYEEWVRRGDPWWYLFMQNNQSLSTGYEGHVSFWHLKILMILSGKSWLQTQLFQ